MTNLQLLHPLNSHFNVDTEAAVPATCKPAKRKLVFLESARGLAALMVVYFHLTLAFAPSGSQLLHRPTFATQAAAWMARAKGLAIAPLVNGPFAVRFFFVLSGFVLSLSYLKTRDLNALRSASLRRYPRLALPVLGTVLFAWFAGTLVPPLGAEVGRLTDQVPGGFVEWTAAYRTSFTHAIVQGFTHLFHYPKDSINYNPCLWSMPVELINSFAVFAALPLIMSVRNRWRVYAVAGAALSALKFHYSLDFMLGIAVADAFVNTDLLHGKWFQRKLLIATALPVILTIAFIVTQPQARIRILDIDSSQPIVSVAAAGVLICLLTLPALQRVLELPVLSFLGRISFGVYLIHMPLLSTLGLKMFLLAHANGCGNGSAALLASAATLAATLIMAWVIHVTLEMPGMAIGKWIDRQVAQPASTPLPLCVA